MNFYSTYYLCIEAENENLNFNIRFGGGKRTQLILDHILSNEFDLIVLTEFVKTNHGQEIIDKLSDNGYKTQASNDDKNLGSFVVCKEDFMVKKVDDHVD